MQDFFLSVIHSLFTRSHFNGNKQIWLEPVRVHDLWRLQYHCSMEIRTRGSLLQVLTFTSESYPIDLFEAQNSTRRLFVCLCCSEALCFTATLGEVVKSKLALLYLMSERHFLISRYIVPHMQLQAFPDDPSL